MMQTVVRIVLLLAVGLASCSTRAPQAGQNAGAGAAGADWTDGVVRYVEIEGGFYGIEGTDGTRYDPVNLQEAFRQDGLAVRFLYTEVTGAVGIRQWGRIVEITAIERR